MILNRQHIQQCRYLVLLAMVLLCQACIMRQGDGADYSGGYVSTGNVEGFQWGSLRVYKDGTFEFRSSSDAQVSTSSFEKSSSFNEGVLTGRHWREGACSKSIVFRVYNSDASIRASIKDNDLLFEDSLGICGYRKFTRVAEEHKEDPESSLRFFNVDLKLEDLPSDQSDKN